MKLRINQLFAMALLFVPNLSVASDTLIDATKAGSVDTVAAEITAGADVNYRTQCSSLDTGNDCTALMFAAARGHTDVLEALIAAGADLEATSSDNHRALTYAAQSSAEVTGTIHALVNAGAETEHKSGEWQLTPLRWAINKHKVTNAITFIELGVDLTAPDLVRDSALNGAIWQRQREILRVLLAHGADPAWINDRKQNAFEFAHSWDRHLIAHPILAEFHPTFCDENPCEIKKFVFKPTAKE